MNKKLITIIFLVLIIGCIGVFIVLPQANVKQIDMSTEYEMIPLDGEGDTITGYAQQFVPDQEWCDIIVMSGMWKGDSGPSPMIRLFLVDSTQWSSWIGKDLSIGEYGDYTKSSIFTIGIKNKATQLMLPVNDVLDMSMTYRIVVAPHVASISWCDGVYVLGSPGGTDLYEDGEIEWSGSGWSWLSQPYEYKDLYFFVYTQTPVDNPPVASFTPNDATFAPGDEIQFDASGSYDPEGESLTYEWDFDNDGWSDDTTVNPKYTYNVVGNKIVKLIVKDPAGQPTSITHEYDIVDGGGTDYDITVTIVDESGTAITGVTCKIGTESKTTSSNGQCLFLKPNGQYTVTAEKTGYIPSSGTAIVNNDDEEVEIELRLGGTATDYKVVIQVMSKDGLTPIEDANVLLKHSNNIDTYSGNTLSDGTVTLYVPPATYDVEITHVTGTGGQKLTISSDTNEIIKIGGGSIFDLEFDITYMIIGIVVFVVCMILAIVIPSTFIRVILIILGIAISVIFLLISFGIIGLGAI